ncbi:MAG: heterocyst frequency control protein PatD [Kaiparowitsia implicata GSE-PSE-MK54-09C]|nr:heterocyst frequency control protein PatD [Kaiparowitsia implicata GSE-PSE-MK54-09C]
MQPPEPNPHPTQVLQQQAQALRAIAQQPDLDVTQLRTALAATQHYFQTQVLTADLSAASPLAANQVRSIHTEINRTLRLLGMDAMFLYAAKKSATQQQRLTQMGDRIDTLLGFCAVLLGQPPE